MIDTQAIKDRYDIVSVIEADLGPPSRKSGRWTMWVCPFHNDAAPSLGVTRDTGTFFCFGCQATGDVIEWVRHRDNLSFTEAVQQLDNGVVASSPPRRQPAPSQENDDIVTWTNRANAFVEDCAGELWEPACQPCLEWLHNRGLEDETLRTWRIGCNPKHTREPRSKWGLRPSTPVPEVGLASGITIPYLGCGLRGVKIRIFDNGTPRLTNIKYVHVARPNGLDNWIYGVETLESKQAILLEAELDALLAWQECRQDIGFLALPAGSNFKLAWDASLRGLDRLLVAYDNDEPGRSAAQRLQELSPSFFVPAKAFPNGKDLTEYHQLGGDINQWIKETTE